MCKSKEVEFGEQRAEIRGQRSEVRLLINNFECLIKRRGCVGGR